MDGQNSNKEDHSENVNNDARPVLSDTAAPMSASSSSSSSTSGTNNEAVSSTQPATVAATAAALSSSTDIDDTTIAQALQMVETLTGVFGFDYEVANEAVNVVGATDVTLCCDYILDRGLGRDTGGAIEPIDVCPHLNEAVRLLAEDVPIDFMSRPCCYVHDCIRSMGTNGETGNRGGFGRLKEDVDDTTGSCPMGENWLCLKCGKVYCSRYVNGHGLQHWQDSIGATDKGGKIVGNEDTGKKDEHCVMVSLTDLSVWCHRCASYLRHESLRPILQRLEAIKFNES